MFPVTGPFSFRKKTRRKIRPVWGKTTLDSRHLQENCCFYSHSKQVGLHSQHELQYNCSITIHIRKLWFTNSATQIVKQDSMLSTRTFMRWIMEKQAPHYLCTATKLAFISVNKWTLRTTGTSYFSARYYAFPSTTKSFNIIPRSCKRELHLKIINNCIL